jgi:outer membrane protein OmpA-like peptidoglycan-associated protein
MRLFNFIFIISLFSTFSCPGQEKNSILPENADCSKLIDLAPKDTVWGPTNPPSGVGSVLEISGEKNSLYAFEKEHNTVWYRFRAPEDGSLTFDIIPVNINDDYDFILYNFIGKNFCADVSNKTLKPVRTCISRNDPSGGSKTGLSVKATDEFVHSGPGPSYCKAVQVKKGDVFVLVLDNVYPGGSGHTLRLHFNRVKTIAHQDTVPRQNQSHIDEKSLLSVTIVDKETHALVKGTARIFKKQKKLGTPVFIFDSVTSINTSLEASSDFVLKIEASGYFDYLREIKTLTQAENINFQAELDRIVVGKNIVFENILFYGNEARFLPESDPSLEILLGTMKKNSRLKIEIQGHVNCPTSWGDCETKRMEDFNMNLSVSRAKAVFEYLMEEGIDPSRMTYNGYGATRMIYPDARSEEKMRLNRRVEIAIVSN